MNGDFAETFLLWFVLKDLLAASPFLKMLRYFAVGELSLVNADIIVNFLNY